MLLVTGCDRLFRGTVIVQYFNLKFVDRKIRIPKIENNIGGRIFLYRESISALKQSLYRASCRNVDIYRSALVLFRREVKNVSVFEKL